MLAVNAVLSAELHMSAQQDLAVVSGDTVIPETLALLVASHCMVTAMDTCMRALPLRRQLPVRSQAHLLVHQLACQAAHQLSPLFYRQYPQFPVLVPRVPRQSASLLQFQAQSAPRQLCRLLLLYRRRHHLTSLVCNHRPSLHLHLHLQQVVLPKASRPRFPLTFLQVNTQLQ
jgi:hypothetical protein